MSRKNAARRSLNSRQQSIMNECLYERRSANAFVKNRSPKRGSIDAMTRLALVALTTLLAGPAQAEVCASASDVLAGFKYKFGEVPAFTGTVLKPAGPVDMMIVVNPK